MYFCKVFGRKASSASAKGHQEGARGLYAQVDLILKKLAPFLTGSRHGANHLTSLIPVSLSEKWDLIVILKSCVKSTKFGITSNFDFYSASD